MNMSKAMASDAVKTTLLISSLAFLILFTQTLLRSLNVAMVISSLGAAAMPSLKLQLLFPKLAIFGLFIVFYRQDRIKTFFYISSSLFLGFFFVMALSNFIYPEAASQNYVLITLHYHMSNMWPVVMYSLLLWVAANQIFSTKQAAISYPIILVSAYTALFAAGIILTDLRGSYLYTIILMSIISIMVLCAFLFKNTKTESEVTQAKPISLSEKTIYIGLLILIFVSADLVKYGLEVMYKETARTVFTDELSYRDYIANSYVLIGMVSLLVVLSTCWMVWAFGWFVSALITPVLTLLMVGLIWHAGLSPESYDHLIKYFTGYPQGSSQTLLMSFTTTVFAGLSVVLVMTTKQMALIPLPSSTKARANAFLAIILGGQAISGIFVTISLVALNADELTPILMYQVVIALIVWIIAILLLAKRYSALDSLRTV